jgi:hypothetical protein
MQAKYTLIKQADFQWSQAKGNKYIMILYDYDSNAILAQPIKDRKAPELLKDFQLMEQELVARGLKPKRMKLYHHIVIDKIRLNGQSDPSKTT